MTTLKAAIKEAKEFKSKHKYVGQIAIRKYVLAPRKLSYHFSEGVSVGDRGCVLTGDPFQVVAVV